MDRAVELVAPDQAHVGHTVGERLGQRPRELRQLRHCPTVSAIRASSAWTDAGRVSPRTTRATTQRPRGGNPMTASMPAANSPPVHGIALRRPDTPLISVVRYRWSTRPARKNIADFASAWLSR